MASRLEEDLSCPVCCELFRDPVVLSCSHSFCKVCLETWWTDKPTKTCPVCKKRISMDPPPSLALKNLVETFTQQRDQPPQQTSPSPAEPECRLHSEKLRLFCLDHQEPVCLVCRDSRTHSGHSFRPVQEAAEELREELRRNIELRKERLKELRLRREDFASVVDHISAQARLTHTQIREEFEKLHQFLREEEESRMKALREEEEQKTQRKKEKMEALSREMEALSQVISETEEQLRAADSVSFLLQYKSALEKVQSFPLVQEPRMEEGALIHQAKHLGNLSFNIWRKMKSLVNFYPVVLDPNTADPRLVLSEDLSSVRPGPEQKLPKNPERNIFYRVDGSERFVSGSHSWVVEVGESQDWVVGVKGTEGVVWRIGFFKGEYRAVSASVFLEPLSVKKKLQRVRVQLDFDSTTVTFSDPDTNTELLRDSTFSGGLTPFLTNRDAVPLKICPKDVTVTV